MNCRFCTFIRYLLPFIVVIRHISIVSANCSDISHGNLDLLVQISVFSGRENPMWIVRSTDSNYQEIKDKLSRQSAGYNLASRLGYSGFIVRTIPGDHARGSNPTEPCTVGRHADRQLENLLLDSAPPDIFSSGLRTLVEKSINDYAP